MKKNNIDLELILKPIPDDRMHELTKQELIIVLQTEQKLRKFFEEKAKEQEELAEELKEKVIVVEDKLIRIKNQFFGKSSERTPIDKNRTDKNKERKKREQIIRLPSERYPNAPLIEKDVDFVTPPACKCCAVIMKDSGMTEDSEYLTVIPKKYLIVLQKRRKYRCPNCHGQIETAPALPRIRPGSSYSDELILDAALSKYCDLLPMERYVNMAARQGFTGLPPQSLIEGSHYLAEYVNSAYKKLAPELCKEFVLSGDETPHNMLEGDKKNRWYMWGFSSDKTCYFECHDTRAGSIASNLLMNSNCTILLSDVYSGYKKGIKDINKIRLENGMPLIKNAYCNAHARRKFKDAELRYPESKEYIKIFNDIYDLEDKFKNTGDMAYRYKMRPFFELLKEKATEDLDQYPSKGDMGIALKYLINNYEGLTLFMDNRLVPVDNNRQERLLRNPVIGRKTWYGTHSIRGAETASILFSLIESCKLNKINPREYFKKLIEDLHQGKEAYTPKEFLEASIELKPLLRQ